jgi:AGCS family alanine or glycine:cation symporter
VVFSLVVYFGATQSLDLVWSFSDIANALMAIPNLISMLVLSNVIVKEVKRFQPVVEKEKRRAKLFAKTTQGDEENVA